MLILKKQLTELKYEVLDTDDGVIEIATLTDLKHCVKDLGLEIQGAVIDGQGYMSLKPQFDYSVKETKFKVLKGIDMHVENGELVKFTYNKGLQNTTIKLSDYCSIIAPHCFKPAWGVKLDNNTHITLILDESLDIKLGSFIDCFYCGYIIVDVSALSDKKANLVYKEAIKAKAIGLYPHRGSSCIIDTNCERFYFYWADCLLRNGLFGFNGQVSRAEEVIPNVERYSQLLKEKYMPLFEYVANAEIHFNKMISRRGIQEKDIIVIKHHINDAVSNRRIDRAKVYKELYRRYFTVSKPLSVYKLYRFIILFEKDEYCDHLWKMFCEHINQFVENYKINS